MTDYCGFVKGYIVTTDLDLHGDKLSPECVSTVERQLSENPDRRHINVGHDHNHIIGDIVEWKIISRDDWRGLWVEVGIYEGNEDFLARMQGDEPGFFSIEGFLTEEGTHGLPSEKSFSAGTYRIRLEVRPDLRRQITEILKEQDVESRVLVRKALDIPTIIDIATTSTAVILALYEIWKKIKEREEQERLTSQQNVSIFNIVINNQRLNFEQNNVDYVVEILERSGKTGVEKKR